MNRQLKTNCPNCGAPYDSNLTKCPYCNTNYFDLSFIDFDATEPFYIKINKSIKHNNTILPCLWTIRVLPLTGSMAINVSQEYENITMPNGNLLYSYPTSQELLLTLGFRGCPDNKGQYMTAVVKK